MTISSRNNESQAKIACALLTIGSGPVATRTYAELKRLVDLRCVVLSRKTSRKPVAKAIREFGLWYAAQSAYTSAVNRLKKRFVTADMVERDGIRVTTWSSKDDEGPVVRLLQELDIELVIVCGFQHILKKSFFDSFEYCFNIHPSLLPHYRGAEPIAWGLLRREKSYGITVHVVDEGIDTGDILVQGTVDAPGLPLQAAVESRQARLVAPLLDKLVGRLSAGQLEPERQGEGSYFPLPSLANRRKYRER